MIIDADSLLPHIKQKVRPDSSDASRHIICPHCAKRTRLNSLGDGRKKCTVCQRKFRIHKATDAKKLQQCAEILLCFCLDFSANRTAQITHHRYRMVSVFYDQLRKLLARKSLSPATISVAEGNADDIHTLPRGSHCRWCAKQKHFNDTGAQQPIFGVRVHGGSDIVIDPLTDEAAAKNFRGFVVDGASPNNGTPYVGFICCGQFHFFTQEQPMRAQMGHLRTWIRDFAYTNHGMWKRSTSYHVKELEWKYNNRESHPHLLARKLIDMLPKDFIAETLAQTEKALPSDEGELVEPSQVQMSV